MRILVLGGYGAIGTRVVARLIADGHEVTGLGRNVRRASRRMPRARWIGVEIRLLQDAEAWAGVLGECRPDAIVNAAGVLQDGGQDDVSATQYGAMVALYAAAKTAGVTGFVQISATRARSGASTPFMDSKGRADQALIGSGLDWTILRPGLVIAPEAYGGTALVRALSVFPFVQPLAFADSSVQCVDVDEVADAVCDVLAGRVESRRVYDLVEDDAHSLATVIGKFRSWHGSTPRRSLPVPPWSIKIVGRIADSLAWFGWRSPFRTTAQVEIAAGVVGDPSAWRQAAGRGFRSLDDILARRPSTTQDRLFARAYFATPAVIGVLSMFWIVTGLVALSNPPRAFVLLGDSGLSGLTQAVLVYGGAIADVALGLGILFRKWVRRAAAGMVAMSVAYLGASLMFAPQLWLDPLGPMLKIFPALLLACVAAALVDER